MLSGDAVRAQAATSTASATSRSRAARARSSTAPAHVLVDCRRALAVQISPPDLPVPVDARDRSVPPPGRRAAVYDRLAERAGLSIDRCTSHRRPGPAGRRCPDRLRGRAAAGDRCPTPTSRSRPTSPPTVQYYLPSARTQFPGVEVQQVYLRNYPLTTLAAQLFGTVGPINPQEVTEQARYRGRLAERDRRPVRPGVRLRQVPARHRRQPSRSGRRARAVRRASSPDDQPGRRATSSSCRSTPGLQQVGQSALQQSIATNYPADGGAFVAMNPQTAQVYAMGSLPDASTRTSSPSRSPQPTYNAADERRRATIRCSTARSHSAGPTGSTFKPITATAALESGAWTPTETYDDTGQFCDRHAQCRHNAGNAAYGVLDLINAIQVSSDDVLLQPRRADQRRPGRIRNGGAAAAVGAARSGSARRPGSTSAARSPGTLPVAGVARRAATSSRPSASTPPAPYTGHARSTSVAGRLRDRRRHRPPVVGRRQRQPRRRPGRRAGHAAAAGGRLRGAGQRGHDRAPARRARDRERRRHRAAEDRPAAGAPHQHQPGLPRHDPRRACAPPPRSRAAPRPTCSATSPSRSTARPAPPSTTASTTTPGTPASCPPRRRRKPIVVVVHVEQGGFGAVGRRAGGARRSSRSGSSASRGRTWPGARQTL